MSRIIKLPEPDTKGTMPLEKAIAQRRSCRDYLADGAIMLGGAGKGPFDKLRASRPIQDGAVGGGDVSA
jgi:hypothetical protein